jgi:hypothetical protein
MVERQHLVCERADPAPTQRANPQWRRIGVRSCHAECVQFLSDSGIRAGRARGRENATAGQRHPGQDELIGHNLDQLARTAHRCR